ncbi:unnamed protein product [Somion occarium]
MASTDGSSLSKLDALIDGAYQQLSSSKTPVLCWRRLYTDACIWRTLAEFLPPHTEVPSSIALTCVARLDRAIIVAGACGQGRLELIHELISLIQVISLGLGPSSPNFSAQEHDLVPKSEIAFPQTYRRTVPRLETPPPFASFVSKYSKGPFIIPAYIEDWPAMNEHPWKSMEYLRSLGGPGRIVPVEVGADYRRDDWTQEMMGWDDFLSSMTTPDGPNGERKPVLYLAQHNLFSQFPALREDVIIPDYVYAPLPPPETYPMYVPPGNREQLVVNAWLGPKGTISPAHIDPFYNFFAQVVGRKSVWLAPPTVSPNMYPIPPPASQASNGVSPSLGNTSRVDVFSNYQEEFPLFQQYVAPEAMFAVLEPGDLLFFPPRWWHAMRSEDTSFSVTMWF